MLPVVGYNRFPDEKGTESTLLYQQRHRVGGYNRFPDEKGTESEIRHTIHKYICRVTTVSPMKRGLKDTTASPRPAR